MLPLPSQDLKTHESRLQEASKSTCGGYLNASYSYCICFRSYVILLIIKCHILLNAGGSNGLFLYDLQEVKFLQVKQEAATGLNLLRSTSSIAQWLGRSKLPPSPARSRRMFLNLRLNVLYASGQRGSLLLRTPGASGCFTYFKSMILLLSPQ